MKEQAFRAPVRDVAEFLDAIGVRTPMALAKPAVVAYQDACHLAHGQNVRAAPRRLLELISGLTLVELSDSDVCCGSAGLYNIEQPDTAHELGRRKAATIRESAAAIVATGNIGCLTQLETHLTGISVQHTIEVLDSAI
jgi:glycolate oxidase iron-sulfur subunit